MKTFIIENEERERIKFLYESKGVILSEESIWGILAKAGRRLAGQSEDDIIKAFKTTEIAVAKSLDDIVLSATKAKNLTELDDLQKKLMHFYNPSGDMEGIQEAKNLVVKFLNGYSKSKGKSNWKAIRDEVQGIHPEAKPQGQAQPKPQGQPQSKPNDDHVQFGHNPPGGIAGNKFSGNRISNRSFGPTEPWRQKIDPTNITNWQGSIDNYNKIIAKAIKTGNFSEVSRKGFEEFGIIDLREFLQKNILKVNEVDPSTGRWSVTFK